VQSTDAVGVASIGVTMEIPVVQGERVDVVMAGIAEVEAGGPITVGSFVSPTTDGRIVATGPAAGVNWHMLGYALEPATNSGDVIRVLLAPGRHQG
jgi:hypothetical protein